MAVLGFLISLVIPLGFIAAVVLVIRRFTGSESGAGFGAASVRRFFQYLLLLGLFVIVALGVSVLGGRLLGSSDLVRSGQTELARGFTFTAIGIPLYLLVAAWARRTLESDPAESGSLGFIFYTSVASLTALFVAMTSAYEVLRWVTGLESYDGDSVARLVVWGAAWVAHWQLESRLAPAGRSQVHHLVGSLAGLVVTSVGLAAAIAASIEILFYPDTVTIAQGDPIRSAVAVVLVGIPVWVFYWVRNASRSPRTPLWSGYVLLVGVAGGLVTAIVAVSTMLYELAVWFVGDPSTSDASRHFNNFPAAIAAATVGLIVWWYHQVVLEGRRSDGRTEVRRIYEYLMAGTGLLAAAGGLTTVLVAVIEAFTGPGAAQTGGGATNTLLGALTLLLVGGPVWWVHWGSAQRAVSKDAEAEHRAPTRRIYLFVLFGLGGLAAVVALLVGVFILFEDIFEGAAGSETIRAMRVALGVLATTGAVASYHWSVYRIDRQTQPETVVGPRFLLVLGIDVEGFSSALADRTGGRVQMWSRTDTPTDRWSVDDVVDAIEAHSGEDELVVIADPDGLEVVPVKRRR